MSYFLTDLLIPVILVVTGIITWIHPPKHINDLIGYRTTRSEKNMETWLFANTIWGKLFFFTGLFQTILTIILLVLFFPSNAQCLGKLSILLLTVQVITLFIPVFLTERARRQNFDSDGRRI